MTENMQYGDITMVFCWHLHFIFRHTVNKLVMWFTKLNVPLGVLEQRYHAQIQEKSSGRVRGDQQAPGVEAVHNKALQ